MQAAHPELRIVTKQLTAKQKRAGWIEGDYGDFLGLREEERALVEIRAAVAHLVVDLRRRHNLTQQDLAERLGSTQSRVSLAEHSDPSVSADFIFRAAIAAGATRREISRALDRP